MFCPITQQQNGVLWFCLHNNSFQTHIHMPFAFFSQQVRSNVNRMYIDPATKIVASELVAFRQRVELGPGSPL
jgi:hypothetical protein